MSFREQLERVVNEVPGCVNCTLLGFDGIAVDSVDSAQVLEGVNTSDAVVEYANVLSQVCAAAADLASGAVEEICVRSEKMTTILRPITDEYLVAATVIARGLAGKGRFLLRVIAPLLREDLL